MSFPTPFDLQRRHLSASDIETDEEIEGQTTALPEAVDHSVGIVPTTDSTTAQPLTTSPYPASGTAKVLRSPERQTYMLIGFETHQRPSCQEIESTEIPVSHDRSLELDDSHIEEPVINGGLNNNDLSREDRAPLSSTPRPDALQHLDQAIHTQQKIHLTITPEVLRMRESNNEASVMIAQLIRQALHTQPGENPPPYSLN